MFQSNAIFFSSSQQLPCLRFGPLKLFWADMASFKGTQLALRVASGNTEIQGHRQWWHARRWGLKTLSRTTDENLNFAIVERALVLIVPKIWGASAPFRPSITTPLKKLVIATDLQLFYWSRWARWWRVWAQPRPNGSKWNTPTGGCTELQNLSSLSSCGASTTLSTS